MSLNHPRRIFRSDFPHLERRVIAAVGGVCLMAAAGVSVAMLPGREAPRSDQGEQMTADPDEVAVIDGGTLRLAGRVVRLNRVDPPSHDTSCSGVDCGAAATNALAAMFSKAPVVCRIIGADDLGRPSAVCSVQEKELNLAIIAAGWARTHGREADYRRAEAAARAAKLGLWASDPTR